jgi:YD repeat-containing protein
MQNRVDGASYDAAGNLTMDPPGSPVRHSYTYDAENRLTGITDQGITYTYDAEGKRWNRDDNNSRGGSWGPVNWPSGPGGIPSASWEDRNGKPGIDHWDVKDGKGNTDRFDKNGKPISRKRPMGIRGSREFHFQWVKRALRLGL